MKFNCFDGKVLNLPELPVFCSDYKNYLLFAPKQNSGRRFYILFYFDDTVDGKILDNGNLSLSSIDGKKCRVISYDVAFSNSWQDEGLFMQYPVSGLSQKIVSCSDDLLVYKDLLGFNDFSIDVYKTEVQEYCLKPIFETNDVGFSDVFGEIFGILPVLVVVLVGFVGIRKGIGFLNGLLRKS